MPAGCIKFPDNDGQPVAAHLLPPSYPRKLWGRLVAARPRSPLSSRGQRPQLQQIQCLGLDPLKKKTCHFVV